MVLLLVLAPWLGRIVDRRVPPVKSSIVIVSTLSAGRPGRFHDGEDASPQEHPSEISSFFPPLKAAKRLLPCGSGGVSQAPGHYSRAFFESPPRATQHLEAAAVNSGRGAAFGSLIYSLGEPVVEVAVTCRALGNLSGRAA
jgi:hypothetical protein